MEQNKDKSENLGITTKTLIKDYRTNHAAYEIYDNNKITIPDPIEKMQIPKKPDCNLLSFSKLSSYLFSNELPSAEDETISLRVSQKKAKTQYLIKGCNAITSQPLEPYDLAVYNSICTIYRSNLSINSNGLPCFTTSMIYENMTGKSRPNKTALNEIDKSIEKMRCILVSFDWTEHAKMNRINKKNLDSMKVKPIVSCENLLYVSSLEMEINGQRVKAYTLIKKPCILEYEELVGQFTTYDHSLLTSNAFSKTKDNVVIEQYIMQRIVGMKNESNNIKSNFINLENFYEKCGIGADRTKRKRKREVLLKVLDNLVKKDYIKSYRLIKENNVLKTIEIILDYTKKIN